jgi:homoserine kinase
LSDTIGFAFAAPDIEVPTQRARRVLPQSVAHELAARGLGRVAALLQGFATGDAELLRIGFTDELHVPYRLPLIPRAEPAMHAAMDAGAWAVTISGSGSGLIAVAPRGAESRVASAMATALQEGTGFVLEADRQGGTTEIEG